MRIYTKPTKTLKRGQEPEWESFFTVLPRKIGDNWRAQIDRPYWAMFETVERKWVRYEQPLAYHMGYYVYRPMSKS